MNDLRLTELHQTMIQQGIIPTELYKYMSISSNLYKLLINSELWFSPPTSFNDPFDCQINDQTVWTEDLIRDYINKLLSKKTNSILTTQEIISKYNLTVDKMSDYYIKASKKILARIGVSCFTDSPYNLLMWSHYADSHKGVCFKFDTTKDLNLFNTSIRVNYSKEYPQFDYLKDSNRLVEKNIQTKSDHWQYENEIRVLQLKNFGSYGFNKESLKEIIFGCQTDSNEIKFIKKIVETGLYPDIKFKQVKKKEYSFSIEISDI